MRSAIFFSLFLSFCTGLPGAADLPEALRSAMDTERPPEALGSKAEITPQSDASFVRRVNINCDRGQTISRALRYFGPTLIIQFRGTCEEDIRIERDNVTLRGIGEDPTIRGTVTAFQSHRITLEDFTVRDAQGSGIEIFEGAAAVLRRLVVDGAGNRCVNVRHSAADISDITTLNCSNVGLVLRGSHALIRGRIKAENCLFGLSVSEGSNAFVRGGTLELSNNTIGLISQFSSSMALIENTTVVANNNVNTGILVANSGSINYLDTSIEARDNGFLGVWLEQFASFGPFSGSTSPLELTGNGLAGMLVEKRSFLQVGAGSVFSNNNFGGLLVADSSIDLTAAVAHDNAGVDISLRFGARATFFDGNDLTTPLDCDDTVVTRGPLSCGGALKSQLPEWPTVPRVRPQAATF